MKKWIDRALSICLISISIPYLMGASIGWTFKAVADKSGTQTALFYSAVCIFAVGMYGLLRSFKKTVISPGLVPDSKTQDVSKADRLVNWLFYGTCILMMLLNTLLNIRTAGWDDITKNMTGPIFASTAAIMITALCFFQFQYPQRKRFIIKGILWGIACVLSVTVSFIHLTYLPKYSETDALKKIQTDTRFVTAYSNSYCSRYTIDGYPYVKEGYLFNWRLDNPCIGLIFFDPNTGKCSYAYQDTSSLDIQSFTSAGVLQFLPGKTASFSLLLDSKSSDSMIKKYIQHNKDTSTFLYNNSYYMQDDDVRLFLNELGEKELTCQLQEIVSAYCARYDESRADWMPLSVELTIKIRLYSVDIATYQNGCIALIHP